MPINTNLTTVPAKCYTMPIGSRMLMNDVGANVTFDENGNLGVTLTIAADQGAQWNETGGGKMPDTLVAISNVKNPDLTVSNGTLNISIVDGNVMAVNVYFEVNGTDAGKQQNANLRPLNKEE